MGYVDRHLGPQERVVFRTRLHPIVFSNAVGFAAFVIFAATMVILHNDLAPATVRLVSLGAAAQRPRGSRRAPRTPSLARGEAARGFRLPRGPSGPRALRALRSNARAATAARPGPRAGLGRASPGSPSFRSAERAAEVAASR